LIDDMVDMGQKNQNLLNNLLPFQAKQKNNRLNKITSSEKQYIKFVETVLKNINKKIEKYPYSKNFHNIFNYDIAQTVNAMRYSRLVNQNPYLINTIEHWLYSPHTLQGMINCTLDLMCAGNFDSVKTGKARESFWLAQKIARISNCLSNWESEFNENDLTNTIFVYLIESNLIRNEDFDIKNNTEMSLKIKKTKIKEQLLKELQRDFDQLHRLCDQIRFNKFPNQIKKMCILYLMLGKYTKPNSETHELNFI